MITNYQTISISGSANENLIPKIYNQLHEDTGYTTPVFRLKFIGFEAPSGTTFSLNNKPMVVPTNGAFYSPYENENSFLSVDELSFNTSISNFLLWIIY